MAFLIVIGLMLYLVPAFVAFARHCKRTTGIVVLNVLLGWTVLGWVGALVWAVSDASEGGREWQ